MSVLPELLPLSITMMENMDIGIYNLTNPGSISHNEILEMYRDIVNPDFKWKNFTIDEQDQILSSKRSNNLLDTSKIEAKYQVNSIQKAVKNTLIMMKNRL